MEHPTLIAYRGKGELSKILSLKSVGYEVVIVQEGDDMVRSVVTWTKASEEKLAGRGDAGGLYFGGLTKAVGQVTLANFVGLGLTKSAVDVALHEVSTLTAGERLHCFVEVGVRQVEEDPL